MRKVLLVSVIGILLLPVVSFTEDSMEGRTGARFTGVFSDSAIDKNGDGYFEQLMVSGEVEMDSAANCVVWGVLRSSDGDMISSQPYLYYPAPMNKAEIVVDSGQTVFRIFFSGQDIRESKTDGPFRAELWLGCDDSLANVTDTIYETFAYSHTAFRETPVEQDVGIVFGLGSLELVGTIALIALLISLLWRIFRKRAIQAS